FGDLLQHAGGNSGVGARSRTAIIGRASALAGACDLHPLANVIATLDGARQKQVGCADACNLDLNVDTVEQWAGDARLIVCRAAWAAAAGVSGSAAAATGVHGGDELEARGIGNAMIGARDHGLTRL